MHPLSDFPEYASVREIKARFGISPATIYRLLGRQLIEAVKVGKATRIVTRSVEAYFAGLPRVG